MSRPDDLMYTETHEWARFEGDVAVVGITDHAVGELGDLAFVDLKPQGSTVEKGNPFGEIESTKSANELFAPVSGEIIDTNTEIVENLHLITESPYGEGWMVKIRMSRPEEKEELLDRRAYDARLEGDGGH